MNIQKRSMPLHHLSRIRPTHLANSVVGAIIRIYGDFVTVAPKVPFFLDSIILCITGNKYAKVFPEPVWSARMQVFPFSISLYDSAWILDGRSRLREFITPLIDSFIPIAAKGFLLKKKDWLSSTEPSSELCKENDCLECVRWFKAGIVLYEWHPRKW